VAIPAISGTRPVRKLAPTFKISWRERYLPYGVHHYAVHRAFLEIAEYQDIIISRKRGAVSPRMNLGTIRASATAARASIWCLP
jgi:hypothetical protein